MDKPPESWDLSPYLGDGTVSVIRYPEGYTEPVTGTIEIMHRNITKDLAEYFLRSEQTQTAFNTGIQLDREGRVIGVRSSLSASNAWSRSRYRRGCGARFRRRAFARAMVCRRRRTAKILFSVCFARSSPSSPSSAISFLTVPVRGNATRNHLRNLDKKELADMAENGSDPIEVVCHNCGSVYAYPRTEIKEMVNQKLLK